MDVTLFARGDGPVNTVGALNGKAHGYPIGPLGSYYQIRDEDGCVQRRDYSKRGMLGYLYAVPGRVAWLTPPLTKYLRLPRAPHSATQQVHPEQ